MRFADASEQGYSFTIDAARGSVLRGYLSYHGRGNGNALAADAIRQSDGGGERGQLHLTRPINTKRAPRGKMAFQRPSTPSVSVIGHAPLDAFTQDRY